MQCILTILTSLFSSKPTPIPPHCIMKIETIVGQDTINSHVLNSHSLSTSNLLVKQCRCDNWFAAPHLYVTNVPLLWCARELYIVNVKAHFSTLPGCYSPPKFHTGAAILSPHTFLVSVLLSFAVPAFLPSHLLICSLLEGTLRTLASGHFLGCPGPRSTKDFPPRNSSSLFLVKRHKHLVTLMGSCPQCWAHF